MTKENLEKFSKIAYDYHKLEEIDYIYQHSITIEDDFDNNEVEVKMLKIYKQKYEFFKQILKDEGYSDEDIQKLEYSEENFKYYYALCFEPECISNIITLVPFLSEEHRQQFIDKHKDYYKKIIPFDPEKLLDR